MNNVNKFVLSLPHTHTSMLLTLIECAVVVYIALCVGRLMGFILILCCFAYFLSVDAVPILCSKHDKERQKNQTIIKDESVDVMRKLLLKQ